MEDTTPDENLELIRRFRTGDEEAFRSLMERHGPELTLRIGQRLPPGLNRRVAVSDVLQESWLVAFRKREELEERGPAAFRNWLLGIVENKLREAARRHRAAKRSADREVPRGQRPATGEFRGAQATPSQGAMGVEFEERVKGALERLPADYRMVLRLVRERGLSLSDAAKELDRSYEATKKLYARALHRLKALLRE